MLSASVVTLNPEHSAHFRQTDEWSLFSRVKTYDLGDGVAKSCGGRAQINHASDSITPWMNSGDACDGPFGFMRDSSGPPGPEMLCQLADQEPAFSWWNIGVGGIFFRNYK